MKWMILWVLMVAIAFFAVPLFFHPKFEDKTWGANALLNDAKVEQPLVIYYDSQSPCPMSAGEPGPMLRDRLISMGMVTVALPTVLVLGLFTYQRRQRDGKGSITACAP